MTERTKSNTFIDYAFKASIFAVILSMAFSVFGSIKNPNNIAYAVVTEDVECTLPEFTSGDGVTAKVVDINSPTNSNIMFELKANPSVGVTFGIEGTLPLGLSFDKISSAIYGNPAEGVHYINTFAQNDCGKTTKIIKIDISELPNTAPTISLNGVSPASVLFGQTFTDPGAKAFDAEEGDLTHKIVVTGTVNTNQSGTYTLTYTVTDNKGSSASVSRTVIVGAKPQTQEPQPEPEIPAGPFCAIELVSDTDTLILGGSNSVATYNENPRWTAVIPGATWVWKTFFVDQPVTGESATFYRDFTLTNTVKTASLTIAADNSYKVYINGNLVAEDPNELNYFEENKKTYNVASYINQGENTISFEIANHPQEQGTVETNPAGLLYRLNILQNGDDCTPVAPINTPPTIKLIGVSPASVLVGQPFTDPGATATDKEDGDLTNKIVVTGTVDTSKEGVYTLTYTVTDSGGLSASITRDVIVHIPTLPTDPKVKINIFATKVVCQAESQLPNWGLGGPNITSTTATDFVASNSGCKLQSDWKFQWASSTASDPGKTFIGEASGWTTFGSTNSEGVASTTIEISKNATNIWVREVLKDGYIPFTYPNDNSNDFSAEMYCHTDVMNFDNYDRVDAPFVQNGNYYCISFNTLKETTNPVNTPPTITLIGDNPMTITVGNTFTDPKATADDLEDGDLTDEIVVTGTVDTTTPGTYTLTYTVTDSGGLTATVTREVIVKAPTVPTNRTINVCLIIVDENNKIATTSYNLPAGNLSIDVGGNGSATTTLTWNTDTFNPNRKTILGINDSDCKKVSDLELGRYMYSEVSTTGPAFLFDIKYNDQYSQPVNNIFDFMPYQLDGDVNADGFIELNPVRTERTLTLLATYDSTYKVNTPPTITLIGDNPMTITVGNTFTDPKATADDLEDGDLTDEIVVTGTVDTTTPGTYTLTYTVTDSGGLTATVTREVRVVTGGGNGGGPSCPLPEITSSLSLNVTVNQGMSYTITLSDTSTTTALSVASSTLPAGLSYADGVISGTPTNVGSYNIDISAQNDCGTTTKTLALTVSAIPPGSGTGGGGGNSGGGGGGGIIQSLTIFNEYVQEIEPGVAMITWNTNLPATRQVVYGNISNPESGIAPLYGYTLNTETISEPLSTTHSMVVPIDANKVYYFRPVSSDSSRTVIGKELTITRGVTTTPEAEACYYLFDFLRQDFNNNPVEVRKLQVFLNGFEGANLEVNGVYDDATVSAVNAFQNKYASDILTPWGHTAPTGYTYILTKKKVNEIYCQRAFPVTSLEQTEIDQFRAFLLGLSQAGITLPGTTTPTTPSQNNNDIQNEIIGSNGDRGNGAMTTLAGVSSTTRSIVSNLTSNVLDGGRRMLNLAMGLFGWPTSDEGEGLDSGILYKWIIIVLILAIVAVLYLWRREYKNNKESKKLEEINKEIDLK